MELGKKGELLAKGYLEKKGYIILEENFRTRFGEIDLIATQDGEIVFIEVKTRTGMDHGLPCESVNGKKQKKIRGVASYYLMVSGNTWRKCRIDVIEILIVEGKPYLHQIRDAF